MKLVKWSFMNLNMPMMEDDSGELLCTNKVIRETLGIDENTLYYLYNSNKSEFGTLSIGKTKAKPLRLIS